MSRKRLWLARGGMWVALLANCWGTMPLDKHLLSYRIALGIVLFGIYPLACLLAGWIVGRYRRFEFGLLFAAVGLMFWLGSSVWAWILWGSEMARAYACSCLSWRMLAYLGFGTFLFLGSWLIGARTRRSNKATL